MNRERTLGVAAAGVLAASLLVAALVPGVVADPTADRITRPGPVGLSGVEVAAGEVTAGTAVLQVTARLEHRGNPAPNVSVRFQAEDAESGLVATTRTVDVGDLTEPGEVAVRTNLTVEREDGYRIRAVVYRNGERVDTGGRELRGLEALQPPYARTGVRFADRLEPLSVSVREADAGANRTRLGIAAALTNTGDDAVEDLTVSVVLRQAESNLVADESRVPVGNLRPGRTATVETTVTVPAGYNYYVDAVLWRDGVVVDTARNVANLDPQRRLRPNETTEEVQLRVSDFERDDGAERTPEPAGAATGVSQPGFGAGLAVLALGASALLARRWSR
jgi:PGF-CTERM protein